LKRVRAAVVAVLGNQGLSRIEAARVPIAVQGHLHEVADQEVVENLVCTAVISDPRGTSNVRAAPQVPRSSMTARALPSISAFRGYLRKKCVAFSFRDKRIGGAGLRPSRSSPAGSLMTRCTTRFSTTSHESANF